MPWVSSLQKSNARRAGKRLKITIIMYIMDIMKSATRSLSRRAAVLGPKRVQVRSVRKAMQQVMASLSKRGSSSSPAYAVMLYGTKRAQSPNVLSATRTFFAAYKEAVAALSPHWDMIVTQPESDHFQSLEMKSFGSVSLYWGPATAQEVKKKMPASPGVYILVSDLDADLLEDLQLPSIPKKLEKVPAVIRVGHHDLAEDLDMEDPVASEQDPDTSNEAAVGKDTAAWRKRFIVENPCLTSDQVAEEATSLATNRAALASRWAKERKIFSVRFERKLLFPKFQFEHGEPLPVVADVMKVFAPEVSGWELAYFFVTPNMNIGGRKPLEFLRQDPKRLVSLAQAFVHPADVF
jgi:hypothetical protein